MEIAPGTRCRISPSKLADQYYIMPGYDGLIALSPEQAARHHAVPEATIVARIAKKNLTQKALDDAEALALIQQFEHTESKED